jgi:hypothetical protein
MPITRLVTRSITPLLLKLLITLSDELALLTDHVYCTADLGHLCAGLCGDALVYNRGARAIGRTSAIPTGQMQMTSND